MAIGVLQPRVPPASPSFQALRQTFILRLCYRVLPNRDAADSRTSVAPGLRPRLRYKPEKPSHGRSGAGCPSSAIAGRRKGEHKTKLFGPAPACRVSVSGTPRKSRHTSGDVFGYVPTSLAWRPKIKVCLRSCSQMRANLSGTETGGDMASLLLHHVYRFGMSLRL